MAITNNTGWTFTYAHIGHNWPRIYIKALDLTAHFNCQYDRYGFAIPTKKIFFTKGNTLNLESHSIFDKLALKEVPIVVLSEICRDIDLFIAVTSVANNPELSKSNTSLETYRTSFEKGLFLENATIQIRQQILTVLIPKLKIASAGFEGNYWSINGQLNDYRINLSSGFAQIKGRQAHLNLLPNTSRLKKNRKFQLPIEEDETLYIILAKALFLQADDQISDQRILAMLQ